MKITKRQLKRIIKEELMKEAGSDPLQILEKVSAELIQDGTEMESWPSHKPASHVSRWVVEKGQQVKQALDMLDADAGRNTGGAVGESLREESEHDAYETAKSLIEMHADEIGADPYGWADAFETAAQHIRDRERGPTRE